MPQLPFDPYDFFGYIASGVLVVAGMDMVLGFPHVLGKDLKAVDAALLILAVYIAGQLVATPAKALLEDGIVEKLLGPPNVNLFRERRPWLRWMLFPGFYKPLPQAIRKKVHARARSEDATDDGESLFLHVRYHPQILGNDKLMAKLTSFLNKYGFARNLAFTSIVVGVALFVKQRLSNGAPDPQLVRYGWTAVAVGILLFYRYLKFSRQYSYEMFNTYAGLKASESGPPPRTSDQ